MPTANTSTVLPKLLIVDDKPANLAALQNILEDVEVEVIATNSGNEALTHCLQHDFALILLDIQMPVMNGYEVARWLRKSKQTKNIPIIFLTAAYSDESHRMEGYDAGAVDYLQKPIDDRILLSKVGIFLELYNLRQQQIEDKAKLAQKNTDLEQEIVERERLTQHIKQMQTTTAVAIKDINIVMSALAGGDFSKRVETSFGDDLGQLATHINRTIDDLEKTNNELKDTYAQLVQSAKLSALGELTAGVAHELNQPLNGIKIISQSILRDIARDRFETTDLQDDLKDIVDQVNRMATIIDHMRVFTRRTTGSEIETLDIAEVIEGPLKLMGQQLKNNSIDITTTLDPDLPAVIGNPISMEQVFMNLISNAKNAMLKSSNSPKQLLIHAYGIPHDEVFDQAALVIAFKDNGEGVPDDIKAKIFDPFFTTNEPGKGTGLGLSVSNKIIAEHKGRITLDSTIGVGSEFKIILPKRAD